MKKLSLLLIAMMLVLLGCDAVTPQTPGKPSSSFLPNLASYTMTDAVDVVAQVNVLDRFAEFVTGQSVPNVVTDIADMILLRQLGLIQNYLECIMGKVDAFSIRFYSHQELKNSLGAVLSVNWDRFASVINQLGCLVPNPFFSDAEADPGLRPCSDGWEYREGDTRYYFIYVGTSTKICEDFAESLPRNA